MSGKPADRADRLYAGTPDMMVHAGLGHRAGIKLQTLLCGGGSALPRALVSELAATPLGQRLSIFNLYGPTECCVDANRDESGCGGA